MKSLFIVLLIASFGYLICANNCLQYLLHRSIDGSCNNILIPNRGKSGQLFSVGEEGSELYPEIYLPKPDPMPTYANENQLPQDGVSGNARRISRIFHSEYDPSLKDPRNKTIFEVFFAQFVAHDLENNRFLNPSDAAFEGDFSTYIRERDDPLCTHEGVYRCTDTDPILIVNGQRTDGVFLDDGTFRGINNATVFADLNVVYGDNDEVSHKLRTKVGGKLITTNERTFNVTMLDGVPIEYTLKNFLPIYDDLQVPLDRLFTMFGGTEYAVVGGEHRINENIGIGVLHTVFLREHNRLCDKLMEKNLLWKLFPVEFDEVIYQRARHIAIAKYQKIIYEQFLPSLLGQYKYNKLGQYGGYNTFVDPRVTASFAAGAFRYGHFIMKNYPAIDECGVFYKHGRPTTDETHRVQVLGGLNPIPDALTHIGRLIEYGSYENVARGMISEVAMPINFTIHPDLANLSTVRGGFDLMTLDLMRARYNGVPRYIVLRRTYYDSTDELEKNIYGNADCPSELENDEDTEDPVECFMYITSNVTLAERLKDLYGKVSKIDGFVGMMVEEYNTSTSIGETAGNIIIDQFRRLRDGDRFFYKKLLQDNYFVRWEEEEILNSSMGDLLRKNLEGDEVSFPDNPFILPENYVQNLKNRC